MYKREEYAPKVSAGAKLLDTKAPMWWHRNLIDLSELNMSDACKCVLGQSYHPGDRLCGYDAALIELNLYYDHDAIVSYGFTLPDDTGEKTEDRIKGWELLTSLWCEEIQRRREGAN